MPPPPAANGRCSCLAGDDHNSEHLKDWGCAHCRRFNSALPSSSSTSPLLSFDSIPVQDYDKRWRIFHASVKGFTIGAGLKGGLALFSLLARFRRRRNLSSTKKVETTSSGEDLILAVKETLRYGLFLGIFAGTFVSMDELIASLGGHRRSAYILKQDSLPPAYKSFLNKHGGKDIAILQGVKETACGMSFTCLEKIDKHYKAMGVDVKLDPKLKVPCPIIHGNQSCSGHFASFLVQAYKRALPVYLPVYLIPALIVHRQGLTKRPYTILGKSLLGTARSSLFLSIYCSSAWMFTCFLFRLYRKCNIPLLATGTFATGVALAIEKKSRRIEISLYCLARAIESFFTCMADIGYLPPQSKNLKRADVIIFSISTAIIMHCYAIERDVFRSKYLNVLDWVFGVPLPLGEMTPQKN